MLNRGLTGLSRLLLVIVVGGLLGGGLVVGQSPAAEPAVPVFATSTLPPPLLLIVLLDDSRTNDQSPSSAFGTNRTGRQFSDPRHTRREALRRLIDVLHSDRLQTHELAILSYATTGERPRWLTEITPADPFVRLGRTADPAAVEAVLNALAQRPTFTSGPGDTARAFAEVQPVIEQRMPRGQPIAQRPVLLLISDDVPIAQFATSPWPGTTEAWERNYNAAFTAALTTTVDREAYTGYCALPGGRVSVAALTYGAANWVTAAGIAVGAPTEADSGYFRDLLTRTGSVSLFDDQPLLYPIDPAFGLTDSAVDMLALQRAGQDAIDALLTALRCPVAVALPAPQLETGFSRYTLPISTAYQQVRVIVEGPPGFVPVLRQADGAAADAARSSRRAYGEGSSTSGGYGVTGGERTIITLLRDDFPPTAWAGDWTLEGNITGLTVRVEADVDLSALRVEPLSMLPNTVQSTAFDYTVRVLSGETPVTDAALITGLTGTLNRDGSAAATLTFTLTDGLYTAVIGDNVLATAADYRLDLELTLAAGLFPATIGTAAALPGFARSVIGGDFAIDDVDVAPVFCRDQQFEEIRVEVSAFGGTADAASDALAQEALYSYISVEVDYDQPPANVIAGTPTPTPGPFQRLTWDVGSRRFIGLIDCTRLRGGSNQTLGIRARLNDDERAASISFSFQPTAQPTPTPTPTLIPTTAATPAPARPSPLDPIIATAESPLGTGVLIALALVFAGVVLLRVLPRLGRLLFPLAAPALRVTYLLDGREYRTTAFASGLHRFDPRGSRTLTAADIFAATTTAAGGQEQPIRRDEAQRYLTLRPDRWNPAVIQVRFHQPGILNTQAQVRNARVRLERYPAEIRFSATDQRVNGAVVTLIIRNHHVRR